MDDCILWPQPGRRNGYGETFRDGKVLYAHRLAWEEAHGPIADGLTIHHRCEVRACINTKHMELLRRDDHAGALGHGKLTREEAREIRDLAEAGLKTPWIAAAYGVSKTLVIFIRQRKRWAAA